MDICKKCYKKKDSNRYYHDNKIKNAKKIKEKRKLNKDKKKQADKEYKIKNKEKIALKQKKYYEENRNELLEYSIQYRLDNKEKIKQNNLNYRNNNIDVIKINLLNYKEKNYIKILLLSLKHQDRRKKRNFNISYETVVEKLKNQNNKCYYCGIETKQKMDIGFNKFNQLSIDRKNSDLGHICENVVICCLFCNLGKSASLINDYEKYLIALKTGFINEEILNQNKDTKWASYLSKTMKKHTARENIPNEFTYENIKELYDKQNGKDFFTDLPMIISKKKFFPFKPSIDRLDNDKPHTLNNCVLVCHAGNMGRSSASTDEYKDHINILKKINYK